MAEKSRARKQAELGHRIYTEIVPFDRFFLAEDNHQKYELRQERSLAKRCMSIYPSLSDFVNSTAAARVNGYLGGNGARDRSTRTLAVNRGVGADARSEPRCKAATMRPTSISRGQEMPR